MGSRKKGAGGGGGRGTLRLGAVQREERLEHFKCFTSFPMAFCLFKRIIAKVENSRFIPEVSTSGTWKGCSIKVCPA